VPPSSWSATVACLVGGRSLGGEVAGALIPAFPLPEDTVRALASVVRYGQWCRRETGPLVARAWDPPAGGATVVGPGVRGVSYEAARRIVGDVLALHPAGRDLDRDEVAALLQCYGIMLWAQRSVAGPLAAVAAAAELGYPVVVKAAGGRHQVDTGGVRLAVGTAEELIADVTELQAALGPRAHQVVVQAMAPTGIACRVGTAEDPLFGPLISFAIAGETADLVGDVAYRIPPLRTTDVSDLVRGVKSAPLLFGHGGRAPVAVAALETVVARLSLLAADLPQVASLVLQPVLAHPGGCEVLDAAVRVAAAPNRTDSPRRALPEAVSAG